MELERLWISLYRHGSNERPGRLFNFFDFLGWRRLKKGRIYLIILVFTFIREGV